MRTAYELVRMAADRAPDQLALVDDRSERALTFQQLIAEVDAVAAGLAGRGIGGGARVLTALPNLFEHCLALLALQRLAAVPALLNFRLGVEEIGLLADRAEVSAAFVLPDPKLLDGLRRQLGPEAVLLAAGEADGATPFSDCRADPASLPPAPEPDPEDESFLFYTSGTTGLPKAVVLAHRTDEPRIVWLSTMMGLRSGSGIRALGVSPLSHAIGFHGVFLATLAFGGTFYTLSEFVPDRALDLVERHRLNYLFSLPTIYAALVEAPSYRPERMRSVETVYWGGAPIEAQLLDRLKREWPASFGHIYGTTEIMCALANPEPDEPDRLYSAYSARVRVVKIDGEGPTPIEADAGEQGELLVDATGDAVFSGYLGQPEETAKKVRDGWYRSGDAAIREADGSIRLVGRTDDMIRSGGEYIQPEEVESCLLEHPHVAAAAIVGVPDPKWGQVTVAAIVPAADVDAEPDVQDIDRHCRQSRMANFKRPRAYLVVDALPISPGGKLQRKLLRDRATAGSATAEGELQFV